MSASLVGSEMCIRDRSCGGPASTLIGPSNKASNSLKKATSLLTNARFRVLAPYSEASEGASTETASSAH
eukprot:1791949-Alexandrium_andersonii.AAC.1